MTVSKMLFSFSEYHDLKDFKPIFLPEIGTFFNQDMALAHRLIDTMLEAGVSAIKGEILHDERIALNVDYEVAYYDATRGTKKTENYRDLIARKIVSLEEYETLFSYPKQKGIALVLSVYDFSGADFALSIGADALKIASSNIVHRPLIEYLAHKRIPTIIDTGKSHFYEIARAVEWFRMAGGRDLLLQHSPAAPPAPASQQHLSMLPLLNHTFECPVGLSDHAIGTDMLLASIPLGASLLEKGIILPSMAGEQDAAHAMPAADVAPLMRRIEAIHDAVSGESRPAPSATHPARMGIVAADRLKPGTKLSLDKVRFAWPVLGISVDRWSEVEGRQISETIAPDQPIKPIHLL